MLKQSSYRIITIGAIIASLALLATAFFMSSGFGFNQEPEARAAVSVFGAEMQKVSLLAPDASSTMATVYGQLVTPELLAAWQADPQSAPGRLGESSYPASITILSSVKQGSGYIFVGEVNMETSAGPAGSVPVVLQVIPERDAWLIAVYQVQATSSLTN